jgi:hypothetical protein
MDNGLFRKKGMERISSPEELHNYMRVTSPRLWMILGAVIALLIGFIVYACTATIENVIPITVQVYTDKVSDEFWEPGENRDVTVVNAEIPYSTKYRIEIGMKVRLGDEYGKIGWLAVQDGNVMIMDIIMDKEKLDIPDGDYDAEIILETTSPISFLFN